MHVAVVIPNYNSSNLVRRAVDVMLEQHISPGDRFEIIVVDDGSTDDSAAVLADAFGERIKVIRLPENKGRSTGRNVGAGATCADVLLFVDSDCIPVDSAFISAHISKLGGEADVSFGAVCTPGNGFWDRMQRHVNRVRVSRFSAGDAWVFTTQNVAVRKTTFDRVAGFDPAFDRHGFEDRDLFIRLSEAGARVSYTADAKVLHEDRITLGSVCRKFSLAGLHCARAFRQRHPSTYAQMAFARFDAGLHPWLRVVDVLSSKLVSAVAGRSNRWLEYGWLPFSLRLLAARAICGLSYLHGTVMAGSSAPEIEGRSTNAQSATRQK